MKTNYLNTVKAFVVDNFLLGDDIELRDDISFLESNIIDSTGILELVMFLEEEFKIKISDDELIPENLDSLEAIDRFLRQKLNSELPVSSAKSDACR